jgi:hypothetical protein
MEVISPSINNLGICNDVVTGIHSEPLGSITAREFFD